MSEEHYLPAALGRFKGYEPLLDRLCRDCNKQIGNTCEEPFLRAGPIAFLDGWLETKAEMVLHHLLFTEEQVVHDRFI